MNLLQTTPNTLIWPAHDIDGRYLLWPLGLAVTQSAQRVYTELICAAEEDVQGVMLAGRV